MMSYGGAGVAGARLRCAIAAASRQADVDPVHPGLAGAVDAFTLYRVAHHLWHTGPSATDIRTRQETSWQRMRNCDAKQPVCNQ